MLTLQDNFIIVDLFSCDFENGTCGIIQDQTDQFDWLRFTGPTPTIDTGPDTGAEGSNWYFYIETSDPRVPGDQAR